MNRRELALRKELAVMHLRIARAELALERTQRPSAFSAALPAVDLACAVLDRYPMGRVGHYLRIVLRVARIFLNMQHGSGPPRVFPASDSSEEADASTDAGLASARAHHDHVENGVA